MKEVWKRIPSAPNYEVSDLGRVRRAIAGKGTRVGKIKSQHMDSSGRMSVNVSHAGVMSTRRVHQLVMEAFVGPCPDGLEVCHGDGNASNNRRRNLRYDTRQANTEDKLRHGTIPRGESHWNATISDEEMVAAVLESRSIGQKAAAAKRGIHCTTISKVLHGASRPHLAAMIHGG